MKEHFMAMYKKHGRKFIIGWVCYAIIKWGIVIFFGKQVLDYFSQ